MKLIDADAGYEVLDKLFKEIQDNEYMADQEMLDRAWKEWRGIPAVCDADKVLEQLADYSHGEICHSLELCPYEEDDNMRCENCGAIGAMEIVKRGFMAGRKPLNN